MAMPPKRRKVWTEVEIAPIVSEAYEDMLKSLRDLPLDRDKEGEKIPFAVRMTPAAKTVWVQFYTEWAAEQANAEGDMAAALSKLEGYAARLALIHHVVSRGRRDRQRAARARQHRSGDRLGSVVRGGGERIYTALAESDDEKHTRNLIELIRCKDARITARTYSDPIHAATRPRTTPRLPWKNSRRWDWANGSKNPLQRRADAPPAFYPLLRAPDA